MILRWLILNGILFYHFALYANFESEHSITISGTFKSSFAFHAVVDTSVASAHSVVKSDWSTTFHRVLCVTTSH